VSENDPAELELIMDEAEMEEIMKRHEEAERKLGFS